MIDLFSVGNFNIDNIVTSDNRLMLSQIGGNAVYSAVGMNFWANDVGIVSLIPPNYPDFWVKALRGANIDLEGVKRVDPKVEIEEWFFYDRKGNRIDHLYAHSEQIVSEMGLEKDNLGEVNIDALIKLVKGYKDSKKISFAQFRAINPLLPTHIPDYYFSAKGCHIAPNKFETQLSLTSILKQKGILISLDPAKYYDGLSHEKLNQLLSNVDIFIPSLMEVELLLPGYSLDEAINMMIKMGPEVIAVKLGEEGSIVWDSKTGKSQHIPVYKTNYSDLTGAGDAYAGGFLFGMIETKDPFLAACYGSVSASLVIQEDSLLFALSNSKDEANRRLEDFKSKINLV